MPSKSKEETYPPETSFIVETCKSERNSSRKKIKDSSTSSHLCGNKQLRTDFLLARNSKAGAVDGIETKVQGTRTVRFLLDCKGECEIIKLNNVLFSSTKRQI